MSGDGTILLVEDNQDDEALTLRAFNRNKIRNPIVCVRDGQEALDWLFGEGAHAGRNVAERPAVVLLDLKLPKVDDLEVLRRVRANPATRLTPIVILTSSREDRDRLEGYSLGANSYIQKPDEFDRYPDLLRLLRAYWQHTALRPARPRPPGP